MSSRVLKIDDPLIQKVEHWDGSYNCLLNSIVEKEMEDWHVSKEIQTREFKKALFNDAKQKMDKQLSDWMIEIIRDDEISVEADNIYRLYRESIGAKCLKQKP